MAKKTTKQTKRLPPAPCCCAGEQGQGISLTTIVIAVLGLIVLVVLIVIFTGQTGKFTKGTSEAQGGTVCESSIIYPSGVGSSLEGRWQNEPCGSGQTETFPTYPADVASHGGMHCCKGVALGSRPAGVSPPAP